MGGAKGFGFARFATQEEADAAIATIAGKEFLGRFFALPVRQTAKPRRRESRGSRITRRMSATAP